ncbi:MAG: hypothetical protein V4501_08705 [Pseudomonadota bacterium]
MALISVLLFMLVFALFSWCALENNLLEMKMNYAVWHKNQIIAAGKQQLAAIEQHLPEHCRVGTGMASQLFDQPLAGWRDKSCAGNFQAFLYYYVIESLGSAACVAYYRITLLIVDAQQVEMRAVLQSTLVQTSFAHPDCHGKISGRQTFHILM